MVLQAHLKKTHYCTWGLVIDVHFGTTPPGLAKDHTFSGFFFLLPSLSCSCAFGRQITKERLDSGHTSSMPQHCFVEKDLRELSVGSLLKNCSLLTF